MSPIYLVISRLSPLNGYRVIIDSVALFFRKWKFRAIKDTTSILLGIFPYLNAKHEMVFTMKELKQSHGIAGAGQRYLAELKTAKIHCAVPCCSAQ